jgi:hypothetical protein
MNMMIAAKLDVQKDAAKQRKKNAVGQRRKRSLVCSQATRVL